MNSSKKTIRVKILLSSMFFLGCLINTLLELYRELVIITKQIPASLYFIKLIFSLPIILLTMNIIQRSLNRYSFTNIFNAINLSFSTIFFLMGAIFIPFEDTIQKGPFWTLDIFCDAKMSVKGLNGLLPLSFMFSMWVSTLCYIISELWSSVMIGYAFYTLANYTCTEKEMKEIVPYFSSITALSMIISAILFFFKDGLEQFIPTDSKVNPSSLFFLSVSLLTILIFLIKIQLVSLPKGVEKSKDLSKQSSSTISSLLTSRFLRNMCCAALFYAINAGFIDMSFKNSLSAGTRIHNCTADIYSKKFLITVLLIIAVITLLYNFIFKKCFKTKGIFFPSIVSPISALIFVITVSILSFYNFYFGKDYSIKNITIDIENWIGATGLGFSKLTKYVLFDLAKEMISMRIPPKYRYKYKSIYDGICIKLGKSMVSLYGAILTFFGFSDIRQASPFPFLKRISLIPSMTQDSSVGIIGIEYQLPYYKVDETDIAINTGCEVDKLKIGIDMQEIGVVGYTEDVVSLALSAVKRLLTKYNVNPKDVGKIEVGTESHFDSAKSIKTYLLDLFKDNDSINGCDTTNACYGGTNALLNCLSWMESSFCRHKYSIVVCTDISMYEEKHIIPTSGAGAVAMLIGRDPVYKILPDTLFNYSSNERDFLKHKSRYFPYVDGKRSIDVYKNAFSSVYNQFISKFSQDSFNFMAFHSPFPKLITKICKEFNINTEKYDASLLATRYNGNTYTASLYFSFITLIYSRKIKLNDIVCLYSFGAGCVSSIFCLQKVKEGCEIDDLKERLGARKLISFETYEDILKNMSNYKLSDIKEEIDGYSIEKEENFFRTYKKY